MEGLTKTLQKLKENPMEYWIKEANTVAEKIAIDPVLANKRIPKRKNQPGEFCEDELRTLQPVQLLSKAVKIVFDRVLLEIKARVDGAKALILIFSFLNVNEILRMSTK